MTPFSRTLVAAVVLAVTAVACSDGDAGTTSTTSATTQTTIRPTTTAVSGDFVFGSGTMPDLIPDDFPVPNGATVDSTLVNTVTGFAEAALIVPADIDVVALFFEQNLQARQYTFDAVSLDDGRRWSISFEKDGVAGSIDVAPVNAGVSRATVTIPGTG